MTAAYAPSRDLLSKVRRRLTQHYAARPATLSFEQPVLSITFDDFPASAADTGARVLERHGARGTYYAASGMAGVEGPCGVGYTASDITRLSKSGHEIGCHTSDHHDCARRDIFSTLEDLARNRDALMRMGAPAPCTHAFPYGETSGELKNNLPPRFLSARGILPGLNVGQSDLTQLRAYPLFGAGAMQRVSAALKSAAKRKAWVIGFTHDVSDTPSAWGTRADELDALLHEAHQLGFVILPGDASPCTEARMTTVSVLIPTFRRPDSFVRAVRSVFAQRGVASFEIIAIDNSPEGSALDTFRKLEAEAPAPLRWAHEPKPGVAQARNAAVKLAQGELVAWLDDDEEASPDWLASLIAVRRDTGAQSVFGPVHARADHDADNAEFYERLYTRLGPANDTVISHAHGIGNSLQPRSMFEETNPFDARTDQRGGEDDALFASWAEAGATFAWAAGATVIEHLGSERTHLSHGLKRAFAYGQGPCELAWAARDVPSVARHMCVGAAQAVVYGAASVVVVAGSTPHALALLDRAARGAGKVFWFCEQRFYGEALVRQPA